MLIWETQGFSYYAKTHKLLKHSCAPKNNAIPLTFLTKYFSYNTKIGTNGCSPLEADVYLSLIEDKDILVLGTDGLWDNLYDKDVKKIIKGRLNEEGYLLEPKEATNDIAKIAKVMSEKLYVV